MAQKVNNSYISPANQFGHKLTVPLTKLISDLTNSSAGLSYRPTFVKIIVVAMKCLLSIVQFIIYTPLWLLGKSIMYFSKNQVVGRGLPIEVKKLPILEGLSIDMAGVRLAPPEIKIGKENEDSVIDIMELSKRYNKSNLEHKDKLAELCRIVSKKDFSDLLHMPQTAREMYMSQLTISLKEIALKIATGAVPEERILDILRALAEASAVCQSTWLEVSLKLCQELNGQVDNEDTTSKLLAFILDYKESIIIHYTQVELNEHDWHKLNEYRFHLGKELGLNLSSADLDHFARKEISKDALDKMKSDFLSRYNNVDQLVSAVLEKIIAKPYESSYYLFMESSCKDLGIEKPEEYINEKFYYEDENDNMIMTKAGVIFMLKCIGILKE